MLTPGELERYDRQIIIKGFGKEGQEKLKQVKVVIAGGGGRRGVEGRAMTIIPGKTACLRCVYLGLIPEEKFPVIGVTLAVIGCIQAAEVVKYLVGIGKLLTNKLLAYDGLNMKFAELEVARDPKCEHCGYLRGKDDSEY